MWLAGHRPQRRGLDRNLTADDRVIQGMELLASVPRGQNMGLYEQPAQRTVLLRTQLLAGLPAAERPVVQLQRTDSKRWQQLLEARRHRSGRVVHIAARTDICGTAVPTRRIK